MRLSTLTILLLRRRRCSLPATPYVPYNSQVAHGDAAVAVVLTTAHLTFPSNFGAVVAQLRRALERSVLDLGATTIEGPSLVTSSPLIAPPRSPARSVPWRWSRSRPLHTRSPTRTAPTS